MGNTFKTGNYVNAIFQDTSNNIGIGGSPSGSYKLEVTGTAKVSTSAYFATASGSVGIGTASPANKLQVTGTAGNIVTDIDNGCIFNLNGGAITTANNGVSIQFSRTGDQLAYIGAARENGTDSSGFLSFATQKSDGTHPERMRITSAGNVGINSSSPSQRLEVSGNGFFSGVNNGALFGEANCGITGDSATLNAANMRFYTGNTERMRITSGGGVRINTTATGTSNPQLYVYNADGGRLVATFEVGIVSDGFTAISFANNNGQQGSIAINSNSTTYNTTSDYRLKHDLKDFNALDKVSKIKIYDFAWESNGERNDGVMAHELQEVIPYAVNGKKDAVNEDGSIKPQGVDYSMIVPTLVKAIQELNQQNQDLKSRLDKAGL